MDPHTICIIGLPAKVRRHQPVLDGCVACMFDNPPFPQAILNCA